MLGNLLTDKEARTSQRRGVIKAGEETVRRGQDFWCCLINRVTLKDKGYIKINPNWKSII